MRSTRSSPTSSFEGAQFQHFAQDDLVPLIKAGVKGFKCFLIESGVDEFPCVDEDDLRKALSKLEVRCASLCPLISSLEFPC